MVIMERITMKQIEERFNKWNRLDVQRIRGYFKGAGKTYLYLDDNDAVIKDKFIIFTIPNDKVVFYNISSGNDFALPKKALNFALNFID